MTAICLWSLACGCGMADRPRPDASPNEQGSGGTGIPENAFSYSLPTSIGREDTKGLKVELEVIDTSAAEGFFVDIHAMVDDPKQPRALRSIEIGSTAVFKPPKIGEKIVVYMPLPKEEAWRSDGQLWLTYQVAAGNSERVAPAVRMKILSVDVRSREKRNVQ